MELRALIICGDYSTGCSVCGCSGENSPNYKDWSPSYSNLSRALVPNYIPKLPIDPINNATYFYNFEPNSGGQGSCLGPPSTACEFELCAIMETSVQRWCNDSFGLGLR